MTEIQSSGPPFSVTPTGAIIGPGDSSTVGIQFVPAATGGFSGTLVFFHDGPSSPDTVRLAGFAVMPAPIMFQSVSPETLMAEEPGKPGKFLKPVKRGKGRYPNWANLRDETIAQGGFRPGTSQSDSAGGLRVGVSYMERRNPGDPAKPNWKPIKEQAAEHCWVRLGKWNFKKSIGGSPEAIPKTLRSQGTIYHAGPARGLDSTGQPGIIPRRPLKGEIKKLEPKKTSNILFAELLALKVNIAMSALGKTPVGFGELLFLRAGNFLDGFSIGRIALKADSMMTLWEECEDAEYDSLLSAIRDINRAFPGPLDTLGNWETPIPGFPKGTLRVRGSVNIFTVPFLGYPVPFIPSCVMASSGEVEPEEDFGEEDEDALDGLPAAVRLYQNYPNPFNPGTTIGFRLSETSRVTILIYNTLGQHVATVMSGEELDEGYNQVYFDADGLSSGVYFYSVETEGLGGRSVHAIETGKMVLLK